MLHSLISLRFIAAIFIFIHHLSYPNGFGPIAVTFFFVLSGFIMGFKYCGKFNTITIPILKSFYFKRFIKIYPLQILTFLISLPILLFIDFKTNVFYALCNLFLIHSYFPIGIQVFSFNSVAWFLSDIMFFYFISPFLFFVLYKLEIIKKSKIMVITLIFIILIAWFISYQYADQIPAYSFGWWLIYISPYFRFLDYFTGVITGIIFLTVKSIISDKNSRIYLFSFMEILSVVMLVFSFKSQIYANNSLKMGVYYLPASVLLIFIFAFQEGIISRILSKALFIKLGELSFTIFLIHQLAIS